MKKVLAVLLLIAPIGLYVLAQTKPKAAVKPGIPATIARGKVIYTQQCLSCHMADGGGVPNMNPPLMQTSYVLGDKSKLIKVVLNGFAENVEIDGETFSNNMAPHNFLTDQEIADVLTYVRGSFGNKATAVKAAEVKLARASSVKKK